MIYCFTKNTFETTLDEWIKVGFHNHPEQKEQIEITAVSMKQFM
jgi:hypothetical protein